MSQVTYFQRYSTEENWMTNSTLLLLSRVNEHDHRLFERVLHQILNSPTSAFAIGPTFSQQEKREESVPDGIITQEGFQIIVEVKLRGGFDMDQLKRHGKGFDSTAGRKVLLALARDIDGQFDDQINSDDKDGIRYVATTYDGLINVIKQELSERDYDLRRIVDDYEALCISHDLTSLHKRTMLAVTAGETLNQNMEYRLYYDHASRNHNTPFTYLGLYADKAIVAVGKVEAVIACDYVNGVLVESGGGAPLALQQDYADRIIGAIKNSPYTNLGVGNKFMLVNEFVPTNYRKKSPGPMRFKKYFRLDEYVDFSKPDLTTSDVAQEINGKEWE